MSLSKRAKDMIIGEINLNQFMFQSTNTMLPKKHSSVMEKILQLFGKNVIVVDIASGSERCAVGILVPTKTLSNWVPIEGYLLQTATVIDKNVTVELISTTIVDKDTFILSEKRMHILNEFPKRHQPRVAILAQTEETYELIWKTMSLVFIWEIESNDDLNKLVDYCTSIACK